MKLLLVLFLCGCALPSKERDFCYAKFKYDRDRKEWFAGVRCHHK